MVLPGKHGMVYDMALWAWHGLCSGLVGMAWYVVLLGGPGMVYGMSLHLNKCFLLFWESFRASFVKISQNFIKSPLKICPISQISVHSLWHV